MTFNYKRDDNLMEKTFFFSDRKFVTLQVIEWHGLKDKDSIINEFKKTHNVKASQHTMDFDKDGYVVVMEVLFYLGDNQ